VIVTTYNQHVRLLSPEPWLVSTTKAYSGVGADIVMESITLRTQSMKFYKKGRQEKISASTGG
jgi:hypothetical protein